MAEIKYSWRRKLLYSSFITLIFLLLVLGIGEVIVRLTEDPPSPHFKKADIDPILGWKTKAFYAEDIQMSDKAGEEDLVEYRTVKDGFRIFGDTGSSRPKVLFIGDSFTQSVEVSNDKCFYHLLGDSLDLEVFAYGQAGYGTLQEYLILDQYVDMIAPDLVVLQFCDNDFIDNHVKMEEQSGYQVGLRRPYLSLDDKLYYDQPGSNMIESSRFLTIFTEKLKGELPVFQQRPVELAEAKISRLGRDFPLFDESVRITELIAGRIAQRMEMAQIPILAFSASVYEPQLSESKRIFTEKGIPFSDAPAMAIQDMEREGATVKSSDGFHWNELGHEVAAKSLTSFLKDAAGGSLGENTGAGN